MQWKFWKKRTSESGTAGTDSKMPGPKQLPQQIGGYLVMKKKLDPDWVWSLRCVVRRYPQRKKQFDFRVFDPVEIRNRGLHIANFTSLDAHPELILFQGFYNKYVPEAHFTEVETGDKAA